MNGCEISTDPFARLHWLTIRMINVLDRRLEFERQASAVRGRDLAYARNWSFAVGAIDSHGTRDAPLYAPAALSDSQSGSPERAARVHPVWPAKLPVAPVASLAAP